MENVNVIFRDYEHIFVDSNQTNPSDAPVFGYVSDVSDVVLKSGTSTYFHVSVFSGVSGGGIPLSSTTLIHDGAVAGLQPSKSDRIYQMQAGYPDEHYWGESVPSALQRGTFLCSWLSGNPVSSNVDPVWIDRWYIPNGMSPVDVDALYNIDGTNVYDIPSKMILNAGVYHKYQRMGNEDNERIVSGIGVGDTLRLHLDDWTPSGIVDNSIYGNHGEFVNPRSDSFASVGVNLAQRPNDFGVSFDGKSQAVLVNRDPSFAPTTGDFSLIGWVKSDDWKNDGGDGIFDMGFRGGVKIGLVNGPKTPFSVFVDSSYSEYGSPTNGNLVWINNSGQMVAAKSLSYSTSNVKDIVIDTDLVTWVLDNPIINGVEKHYVYALDYNGNKNATLEIPFTSTATHLELGEGQNLYVYNDDVGYRIDRHSFEMSSVDVVRNGYYTNIGTDDFISDFASGWITNDGIPVSVSALPIEGSDAVVSIRCNADDTVWVLRNESMEVYVSDFDGYVKQRKFELEMGKVPSGFEFIVRKVGSELIEDVYVSYKDSSTVSVYSKQGVKKFDIATFLYLVSPSLKRFSTYDWWRRFGPKNCVYARVCFSTGASNPFTVPQDRYVLTCDLSHFGNGQWHQVALVRAGASLKFFVDAICRDEVSDIPEGSEIVYPFRSPLVIGASCGRSKQLGGESSIKGVFFGGAVDDVRMYSKAVTSEDLYYIYASKFDYQDIVWSIASVNKYYLERVQRFFKFKMPGSKSAHYNIRISGVDWTDETKAILEGLVKTSLDKLTPIHTINNRVIWD